MPAMDRDFCLQVPANSPMCEESPSGQAFQVQQSLCGCACPWLQNTKGEGVAQPCRNTTQALAMIHTFLTSNVLALAPVVQMH